MRDERADVVVVGAGISGALMAHALVADGHRVVVLDRRGPLSGSTMASTALLQFEIDVPLSVLSDRIGGDRARAAWASSLRGLQALIEFIKRERIRCGLHACRSLYLAGDEFGQRALADEQRARALANMPCRYLDAETLRARYGLMRTAALESSPAATLNPAQLTAGVLRRCAARGARIFAQANAEDLTIERDRVVVGTTEGPRVTGAHVVFCTGYELPKVITVGPAAQIKSTWALATTPGSVFPRWLRDTVVWEASDPYLYVRATSDGRLIAGGEDAPASRAEHSARERDRKTNHIAAKLRGLIPEVSFTVSHRWEGTFGESATGLPIISALPDWPRCYCVAGLGGNGITFSQVAADVITSTIGGRSVPSLDLFRVPA